MILYHVLKTANLPSDLHEYQGNFQWWLVAMEDSVTPDSSDHIEAGPNFAPKLKPHPITGETVPITIGHEFSGIVKEIGVGVQGLEVGQKVSI